MAKYKLQKFGVNYLNVYKLQKFGVNYLNVTLAFEGSTEDEVQEMVHTFDFGEIVLVREGKTLSLGTSEPKVEGFNIVLQIEEYEGALEEEIDVLGELDEASIRLGDRFEVEPDYITLFVNKGETTRAIELEVSLEDDSEAILDEVYYKGTKYYTREITAVGKDFKVGTHSLAHVLDEDYEQGEDSEEFISLSDILLFVPDDLIVATDRALLEYFLGELYEREL